MQLGIFAKTFTRPSLGETLDAVRAHGLGCVQFNMSCTGLPPLPETIPSELADSVMEETNRCGLEMSAVSGTFNMIHPDTEKRREGLRRLGVLAGACGRLGTSVITLCTGTRDPEDMWQHHPDNGTPGAWRDLLASVERALEVAEKHGVTLALEPEVNNVVASAEKGRRLMDEMRSPRLKVVMDAANLFRQGELPRSGEVLQEAFELLGEDIVIAHAKDVKNTGEVFATGRGELDYNRYLENLREVGYEGPLILHGLEESEVEGSVAFLLGKLGGNTAYSEHQGSWVGSSSPLGPPEASDEE
jgi:sugar phosphate isomerase/epimerase